MSWPFATIETIKHMKISHRNWRFALNDSFAQLIASAEGEVVSITGPSRAGKSRLIVELVKSILGTEYNEDSGLVPAISILATNCSVGGTFSTKAFTIRALEEVKHPIYGVVHEDIEKEVKRLRLLERTPETVLRPALESALKMRQTRYIFIDEAQHIQYAQKGVKGSIAILESWKCLAQSTGTTLVLVGAYPLLNITKLCTHMLGRKHQVHLPRYRYEENDLMAFSEIIDAYSGLISLPSNVSGLEDWIEYLYEGSMGCIGLLEAWLRDALGLVISYGGDELTLDHLKMARRPVEEEKEIAAEIQMGEEMLLIKKSDLRDESHNVVGFARKSIRKPFQRNPKRYGIGTRNLEV